MSRLHDESTGAAVLLAATTVALVWCNSPWGPAYASLSSAVVGPHLLALPVAEWATDGLLAVFFFVVGLELKHEMVCGALRRPATAVVPVVAAVGGMAAPAALYALVNGLSDEGDLRGWAVPVATDIAFAVAVLTVFGRRLPSALRTFLLTLAVVDDLLGIVVIAVFYAGGLHLAWLAGAAAGTGLFAVLVRQRGAAGRWALLPLALVVWGCVHASGVHSTVAGAALAFTVPAVPGTYEPMSLVLRLRHRWQPVSTVLALPVFALFAAGVDVHPAALVDAAGSWPARGVALGLVFGKPVGIVLSTLLVVRLTSARLDPSVHWPDLAAMSVVAGTGFTVSLLIGELSFPAGSADAEAVKAAVLLSSTTAALLGAAALTWRSRAARARDARVAAAGS